VQIKISNMSDAVVTYPLVTMSAVQT